MRPFESPSVVAGEASVAPVVAAAAAAEIAPPHETAGGEVDAVGLVRVQHDEIVVGLAPVPLPPVVEGRTGEVRLLVAVHG